MGISSECEPGCLHHVRNGTHQLGLIWTYGFNFYRARCLKGPHHDHALEVYINFQQSKNLISFWFTQTRNIQ